MKALIFDKSLRIVDMPIPQRGSDEVLVRITLAGICNTDIEITRGYVPGFQGVPGHEFIGIVEDADDTGLIGKRVTAEINCSCGQCEYCRSGMGRHCPTRTVIGIVKHHGAFAEYIVVPKENVIVIPESISDTDAIFIEPLAAALEILEQVSIDKNHSVLLIGDGKLGQLIGRVLATTGCALTIAGKHQTKLHLLKHLNAQIVHADTLQDSQQFDIVIEASGKPSSFARALRHVKPRGTVILKSTYSGNFAFNPSDIVVNEITLIGSRCGVFDTAIRFLLEHRVSLGNLISARYELHDAVEAFKTAQSPGVMKVVLQSKPA